MVNLIRVMQIYVMNSHTRPTPQIQTGHTTLSTNISSVLERTRTMISALSESREHQLTRKNLKLIFAFGKNMLN